MKKSLDILEIKSSGLEDIEKIGLQKKNDEFILNEIDRIAVPEEQEKYLRKLLE